MSKIVKDEHAVSVEQDGRDTRRLLGGMFALPTLMFAAKLIFMAFGG